MPKDERRTPVGRAPKSKVPQVRVKHHSYPVLKLLAENIFVLSDQGVTYADIAKMPEFAGMEVNTIRQWGIQEDWLRKRKEHLGRLQKVIMDHLGGLMMQQRKKQLQLYDRLHDQLASYVMPNESGHVSLAPKTAEGAITAMLKVEDAAARMRQQMAESLGGSITASSAPQAPVAPEMSQEDAQHLAHLLLAKQNGLSMPNTPLEAASSADAIVDADDPTQIATEQSPPAAK